MAYSDYQVTAPQEQDNPQNQSPKRDNRKLIYGILIAALLATWGYFIIDHTQNHILVTQSENQTRVSDSAKNAIQQEYNVALRSMDSLTGSNTQLTGALAQQKSKIDSLESRIEQIRKANNGDLSSARELVDELKKQVNNLNAQIAALQQENTTLTETNQTVTSQRDSLAQENHSYSDSLQSVVTVNKNLVDIGSTLRASSIVVEAIDGKGNNTKRASKTDLLRITITVDENRIATTGEKSLYLIITAPNGHVISNPDQGSGTFQTRNDGVRVYTEIQTITYTQGTRQRYPINYRLGGQYEPGTYTVDIYQNGDRIGESSVILQKSGFLGL